MDDHNVVDQALKLLHASGWSVGDTAFVTEAGTLVWLVSGVNGENLVEGPTLAAAWRAACDQARAVGMLAGWRVSQPGGVGGSIILPEHSFGEPTGQERGRGAARSLPLPPRLNRCQAVCLVTSGCSNHQPGVTWPCG